MNLARLRQCLTWKMSSSEGRRQELLWRQFFLDSALWWDNRQYKKASSSPDFRLKESRGVLWLDNFYKPAWVDKQLATLDMQMGRRSPSSKSRLSDDADPRRPAGCDMGVTAETLSNLCQHGNLSEAVEALGFLVQTDSRISKSLLYTVLKTCVAKKDLVLGRRVHHLIVKMGYESDTFLCNHILRMYASHARLQEAMHVFTVVANPDAFMWFSIISAHVTLGQANQAIELYHQMRKSSVKPDGHVLVAALQACARGADLKTGRLVHADVLASGVEPDLFVFNSLVDMYAKCGSLEDAERVFRLLRRKDVVTWNAMIAGYAQQGMCQEAVSHYSSMRQEGIVAPDSVTFVCLLQAYVKCGRLEDAQRIFDGLHQKEVVTWNAMIAGYVQQGMGQKAICLYTSMQQEGITAPNPVTFVCLLQACASVGILAVEKGKQLHGHIEERGLESDVFVGCSLVNMYAKCGCLEDAQRVFDGLRQKDVVTWNAMIAGYAQQGMGPEALRLYSAMQQDGVAVPDSVTFVCLLQACASVGISAMEKGKQLHAQIKERGLQADVVVGCSLVNMYAKCGCLEDAHRVFEGLCQKDVVTWNSMIAGYVQQGMGQEALRVYSAMQQEGIAVPDSVTFVCLLQACARVGVMAIGEGKQLHAQVEEQGLQADLAVSSSLVNMYAKCGSLADAQNLFDRLPEKNSVTWTAMIAGYAQQGMGDEALRLYSAMQQEGIAAPDSVTFVCLLQACASVGIMAMEKGKQLHAQVEQRGLQADVAVGSSLVNMYAKCGSLKDAQSVFDRLHQKNLVTWTAMIAGYSQQGMGKEALSLYSSMQQEGIAAPDSMTFLCLLQACASVGNTAMEEGKQLHAQIERRGLQADGFIANSLINMYAKCGSVEDAQRVFDGLPQKDVVTWTVMIAGYVQQGMGQEALNLYSRMQHECIPDSVTFVCLLQACASVAALHPGRQLHAQIEEQGLEADVFVATNLINMYAKCGSMDGAQQVFDALPERDIVAWNALIAGYTRQGDSEVVFHLVHRMREDCIELNDITFLSVLTVCSHAGLVNKGREYFVSMSRDYGITPTMEHYTCMVDLLGRAGQLDEAQQVLRTMPSQPHDAVWHALLGACQKWGNVEVGRHAFDAVVKLDEKDAAAYVMMSNIYTGAQLWEEAQEIQARRRRIGAWKQPGQSWCTDMSGIVHAFIVGDEDIP